MCKIFNLSVLVILFATLLISCVTPMPLQKFHVYTGDMNINHGECVNIKTPENAGILKIESPKAPPISRPNAAGSIAGGAKVNTRFDLNEGYIILKELFGEVLIGEVLNSSQECDKWIEITIDKVRCEPWGGLVKGAYMHFTVETSSGIRKQFKTQDQSGWSFDRAVSGNLSKGVEAILTDAEIQKFINE